MKIKIKKKKKRKSKTPEKEFEQILDRIELWIPDWKTLNNSEISLLIDKYLPDYRLYNKKKEPLDLRAYFIRPERLEMFIKKGKIKKVKVNNKKLRKSLKKYLGITKKR